MRSLDENYSGTSLLFYTSNGSARESPQCPRESTAIVFCALCPIWSTAKVDKKAGKKIICVFPRALQSHINGPLNIFLPSCIAKLDKLFFYLKYGVRYNASKISSAKGKKLFSQ